jgi:hypothetical protein
MPGNSSSGTGTCALGLWNMDSPCAHVSTGAAGSPTTYWNITGSVACGSWLPAPQLRCFHGSLTIDPLRLGRDAAQIAEEVVQHLTRVVGARVEINLEIQAELTEGASEKLVRDVTENCRTLRFTSYGFEEA